MLIDYNNLTEDCMELTGLFSEDVYRKLDKLQIPHRLEEINGMGTTASFKYIKDRLGFYISNEDCGQYKVIKVRRG